MMLDQGTGEDIYLQRRRPERPLRPAHPVPTLQLSSEEALERALQLDEAGDLVILGNLGAENDAVVYSAQGWDIFKSRVKVELQTYHNSYPLRRGAPTRKSAAAPGCPRPCT